MKQHKTTSRTLNVTGEYDVIVCGGGPAGCAAAIAATRCGAKTVLIEKNGCLGGATVAQLVAVVLSTNGVDFQGVWHDYANRLFKYGGFTGLRKAANPYYPDFDWLRGAVDPEQVKRVWQELVLDNGAEVLLYGTAIDALKEERQVIGIELFCRGERQAVLGKRIIDATGNGDIAALAGCSWRRGSEPTTYAQEVSLVYRKAVSPSQENLVRQNECMPRKDRKQVDPLDIRDLTKATLAMRAEISGEVRQADLVATADELGVRTSRIVCGIKTVSSDDAWTLKKQPDGIARSSWELDVHPTDSAPVDPHLFHSKSDLYAERLRRVSAGDWFDIPYGAIVAKDVDNLLLAGRIVSADLSAHGSLRIQQTCMATGEAAGAAAALSIEQNTTPSNMDPRMIVEHLESTRQDTKPFDKRPQAAGSL